MQPKTDGDYKKLFTELIKKQMIVLGPDITNAKVKNVQGIEINDQGEVTSINGDPQAILQSLINQFVELSGMIVKKTMESILTTYPGMAGAALNGATDVSPQSQSQSPQQGAVMGANPFSDASPQQSQQQSQQTPQSQQSPQQSPQQNSQNQGQMGKEEMDSINQALSELSGQSSSPNQPSSNTLENNNNNMSKSTSN